MHVVRAEILGCYTFFGAFHDASTADASIVKIQTLFPDAFDFEAIELEYARSRGVQADGGSERGEVWIVEARIAGRRRYFGTYMDRAAALENVRTAHPEAEGAYAHLLYHT